MRSPCAFMLVTAAVVLTGCANPGPTDGQSGGPACNAAGPATSQPPSAASPQEVMTRLIGYIADDDGPAACGLMIKAAQAAVTQDLGVAPDCPSTISVIASSVSDKDAFRSMKPTGMVVRGDKAKVSSYCLKGWSRTDGNPDDGWRPAQRRAHLPPEPRHLIGRRFAPCSTESDTPLHVLGVHVRYGARPVRGRWQWARPIRIRPATTTPRSLP
jgi:hypothetical protein